MENKGYLDIHTHILPGIDDGSKDWAMTEKMLRMAHEQGIRTIVATPHNYPGGPGQENARIRELCKKADELAKQVEPSMQVLPGNEVFYREGIVREIHKEHILTLADSRYLLVEFHPRSYKQEILRGLRELTENGYFPVIAHVERVEALFESEENLKEALETGCYLQTNCGSLLGGIFDRRTRRLRRLMEDGRIHFLGSDCHNLRERPPIMKDAVNRLKRSLPADCVQRVVTDNAARFLSKDYI